MPSGNKPLLERGIHPRAISEEISQPSIAKINLKITYLELNSILSGLMNEVVKHIKHSVNEYIIIIIPIYWQLRCDRS